MSRENDETQGPSQLAQPLLNENEGLRTSINEEQSVHFEPKTKEQVERTTSSETVSFDQITSVPFLNKTRTLHLFFLTLIFVQVIDVAVITALVGSDILEYNGFESKITTFDVLGILSNIVTCFLLIPYYLYFAQPKHTKSTN